MTTMVLLGAGAGLGIALLMVWLMPPVPALGAELTRLVTPESPSHERARGWRGVLARLAEIAGAPSGRIIQDLAVLERPVRDHLAAKAVLALAGVLIPPLVALAALGLGVDTGIQVPLVAALASGVAGFWLPDHRVRRHAADHRRDFRHALSAFLDLVVISLAGGAGVDSALTGAADAGQGKAFTQLRRALAAARLIRDAPWNALRQLGRDLGISELIELAAAVSLAGTQGAAIRRTLQARATALRARQLTDAESDASADSERMSLPVMALFLGFLCFITYPATAQVLAGL